jgi:hypothetical protein
LLLEEYLQAKYWNLPVTGRLKTNDVEPVLMGSEVSVNLPISSVSSNRTIEQINSNIVLTCLLLNCIERCAKLIGVSFQVFLIDVLYQLLEKVGSDSARVSRCALTCLGGVAASCSSGTVAQLIQENADYLVNSVSLKLRHIERFPEAPMVLRVALTHGDIAVLPLVNDLVLEVACYSLFYFVSFFFLYVSYISN